MRRSPAAVRPAGEAEQTEAFRVLFQQQGERLWNADRDIDWDRGAQIPDAKRASWLRIINTFHGLEVMGLDTIQVMMGQATHQLRNPSLNLYLAAQCQDEARHVYVLDRYLTEGQRARLHERRGALHGGSLRSDGLLGLLPR